MVEKKVIRRDREDVTKGSKEVKVTPMSTLLRYTRKGHEVNMARNCKITTEKEVSIDEANYYESIFDKERQKNEKRINRLKKTKKEKIVQRV